MIIDKKLALHDRLEVALDIIINIKNDMKIEATRADKDSQEYKEYLFLALKASEAAMAVNTLAQSILLVEDKLASYLKGE